MKHLFGKLILTLFTITLISAAPPVPDDFYKIGDQASDFSLKNIDGKMVSLASIKGVKGYIVVFTCNTCPYAVMYEDRIIELHNKYAPQGYPVVAINPNDPEVKPGDSFADMQIRARRSTFHLTTCLMKSRRFIHHLELREPLMCFCWTPTDMSVISVLLMTMRRMLQP